MGPKAFDRLGDGSVDLIGEAGHECECFYVTVADAAAVGAQDAADECGVLVVLDGPPTPVWCQPHFGTGSPGVVARTSMGGPT